MQYIWKAVLKAEKSDIDCIMIRAKRLVIFTAAIMLIGYILVGCFAQDVDLSEEVQQNYGAEDENFRRSDIYFLQITPDQIRSRIQKAVTEMIKQNMPEIEVIENPYFPAKEHTSLKVHAEYYDRGFVDETADAEINRIKIYDEGSVYKLTIHIKPNMSSWYFKSGDIMSMYFYVTADKIYWILSYAQLEPGGKSIYFYDDDDLLVKTLDTDEKLRNKGVLMLICQEEEMQEEFFSITKEGNRITYDYSETKVNGEPGGEELFVWKRGKGLVEFGTGFGPGPLDVHIDEICEVAENLSEADFNDKLNELQ